MEGSVESKVVTGMQTEILTSQKHKWIDRLLPAMLTLLLFGIVLMRGGFYFSSNDDSLLTDILCGSYSGGPEAHDVYHLYPLAAVLSFLYKIIPQVAWYGGMLVVIQLVCIYLVLRRMMEFAGKWSGKLGLAVVGCFLAVAMLLGELQFIQYTMTSAILGATAIFLLVTEGDRHPVKIVILYVLACLLRSQMGLLLLPFLGTACFFRWIRSSEKKKTFWYDFAVVGVILGAYLVSMGIHTFAYRGKAWQNFQQFNQSRTDIYDYGTIPAYDNYPDFYQDISVSREEQYLLETMNFSLCDKWDNVHIEEVNRFQKELGAYRYSSWYFYRAVLIVLKQYVLGIQNPYGILLYAFALLFCILCILDKKFGTLILSGLAMGSSHVVCWVYLVWQNRMVDRVMNGLYLAEVTLLIGMCAYLISVEHTAITAEQQPGGVRASLVKAGISGICVVLSAVLLWMKMPDTNGISGKTVAAAKRTEAVQEYCKADNQRLYLLDTISFAPAKERITAASRADNMLLCGSWIVNSPLYDEKLERFVGGTSLEQALPQNSLSFIVSEDKDITWFQNYLETREHPCRLVFREKIVTGTDEDYLVYDVTG